MNAAAFSGVIAGSTPMVGAVKLAGALAEAGVCELELMPVSGPTVKLAARVTDLPGVVTRAAAGSVLLGARVRVTIERGGLRWETRDADVARRLEIAGQSASE